MTHIRVYRLLWWHCNNDIRFMRLCCWKLGAGERWSKAWLHLMKKDNNSSSCNACKMIISNKRGNIWCGLKFQEYIPVFDTVQMMLLPKWAACLVPMVDTLTITSTPRRLEWPFFVVVFDEENLNEREAVQIYLHFIHFRWWQTDWQQLNSG